jgi:hypothetical protein
MNILKSFYALRPDTDLYHYTESAGFYGILSNKTMWATHIQFLNDSSEFHHALKMILNRINQAIDENSDGHIVKMLLAIKKLVGNIVPNTFIISFSENRDVLSQWRGYCPNGGYNIAFSPKAWDRLLEKNSYSIVKCQYEEDDQLILVNSLVESAIVAFPTFDPKPFIKNPYVTYTQEDMPRFFASFWFWNRTQKLATAIKNRAFKEEGEWRLIGGLKVAKIGHNTRMKGSLLVPYQNFSIDLDGSLNHVVTGVTIGPNPNADLAQFGVNAFRFQCGITTPLDVVQSQVPYRQL